MCLWPCVSMNENRRNGLDVLYVCHHHRHRRHPHNHHNSRVWAFSGKEFIVCCIQHILHTNTRTNSQFCYFRFHGQILGPMVMGIITTYREQTVMTPPPPLLFLSPLMQLDHGIQLAVVCCRRHTGYHKLGITNATNKCTTWLHEQSIQSTIIPIYIERFLVFLCVSGTHSNAHKYK